MTRPSPLLRWPGARLAARRMGEQTTVTVVVLAALSVVVGSLEGRAEGVADALALGLLRTPTLLVSVLPAAVAVGAGLGAARATERGERLSLASAGVSTAASGRGPLLVGLAWGLVGLLVHTGAVPVLEAAAERLAPHPTVPWVWLEGAAVHADLGFLLPVEGGRLGEPTPFVGEPTRLAQARAQLRPEHAPMLTLFGGGPRCAVELVGRALRPLACSLLAWLAWQRWSAAARGQAAAGGLLGLGWLALDAVARQWVLETGTPVVLSGMATGGALCVAVGVAYRTWSQKPV